MTDRMEDRTMSDLALGQRVGFDLRDRLVRIDAPGADRDRWPRTWVRTRLRWGPREMPGLKPQHVNGVIVGMRWLSDGDVIWNGPEDQAGYKPTSTFAVWLVAYHMRKAPVYVLPEDVHLPGRDDKHDRAVAAKALRDAAADLREWMGEPSGPFSEAWLRTRADRIEAGGAL